MGAFRYVSNTMLVSDVGRNTAIDKFVHLARLDEKKITFRKVIFFEVNTGKSLFFYYHYSLVELVL